MDAPTFVAGGDGAWFQVSHIAAIEERADHCCVVVLSNGVRHQVPCSAKDFLSRMHEGLR